MPVEYDYVYRTHVIDGRTYWSSTWRRRHVEGFSYYYRPSSSLRPVAADDTRANKRARRRGRHPGPAGGDAQDQEAAAGGVRGVPQGFRRRGQAQGHAMRPRLPRRVHLPVAPP
jgi:hypothetical protein